MPGPRRVALLAEGVDRNSSSMVSACSAMVALLAEGVDRNGLLPISDLLAACRPPRGGRG